MLARVGVFMKNPQTENGYTRVANELLDAFARLDVSGSAWRVFMVIIRKTYGFQKKSDKISLSQFVLLSGLTRRSVCRGVDELIKNNVIRVEKDGYTNAYSVQKDYQRWGSVKPVTSDKNDTKSSVKPVTKTSDKNDTYKRKKDNKDNCEQSSRKDMGWKQTQGDDPDLPDVDLDSGEIIKPKEKPKRHYREVYALFYEILNISPLAKTDWIINTTEQKSADNLYTSKGLEQVRKALELYEENKDAEFCPKIYSPSSLVRKWKQLHDFKEKNNL